VDRVIESEDSSTSFGVNVVVSVPTTLRCRSRYSTANAGSIAV